MNEQEKLIEIINDFFGCDAAYYDINPLDLAIHLLANGVRLEENQATSDESNRLTAVEVVHGRWKNVKETEVYSSDHRCTFTHTAKTCSACNVRIGFIGANFYLYDAYCPNCGAKMDGGVFNGSAESD